MKRLHCVADLPQDGAAEAAKKLGSSGMIYVALDVGLLSGYTGRGGGPKNAGRKETWAINPIRMMPLQRWSRKGRRKTW